MKIAVPNIEVTEKTIGDEIEVGRLIENDARLTEKLIENRNRLIEKLIEKAEQRGDKLTKNRVKLLRLIVENPYISKTELSKALNISITAVSKNIEILRNKYLH